MRKVLHSFEVHSNESACRKSGRLGVEQVSCDINVIQKVPIHFVWLHSKWIWNVFFPTTNQKHPITFSLFNILPPSLILSSISPMFSFTTDPTMIFVFYQFASLISLVSGLTSDITFVLRGGSNQKYRIPWQICNNIMCHDLKLVLQVLGYKHFINSIKNNSLLVISVFLTLFIV